MINFIIVRALKFWPQRLLRELDESAAAIWLVTFHLWNFCSRGLAGDNEVRSDLEKASKGLSHNPRPSTLQNGQGFSGHHPNCRRLAKTKSTSCLISMP
jgi:hypothetical protein